MGIQTGTKVRRVVTGHDKDLKSIIQIDDEQDLIHGFASSARTVWQHSKYPAELSDKDAAEGIVHMYSSGSLIRVVDFPANTQGHNHATWSVDYAIMLEGELELLLEDGSRTIIKGGDIVVQQATVHQWNNVSEKPARIVFALLPSAAPEKNGQKVPEFGFPEAYAPKWREGAGI